MNDATNVGDPPSRERCLALMGEYEMLLNIRDHSLKVCQVSMVIARVIQKAGAPIDLALVEAGALLHDITKTKCLGTKENHAETGEKLLAELGYPKTGRVVGEHIIPDDRGDTLTPAEIVAYADKRVLHDKVVDLEERFGYLMERYGSFPEALEYYNKMRSSMHHIEKLIERTANQSLQDLLRRSI
ncbi:MAG: HDIG domain-containing protein [Proteobacteria bacterium]|nr:HDIG domain-containing protein [Pseudomonadota bacterium]